MKSVQKVSDFGLTRDVYIDDAYWKKSNGRSEWKFLIALKILKQGCHMLFANEFMAILIKWIHFPLLSKFRNNSKLSRQTRAINFRYNVIILLTQKMILLTKIKFHNHCYFLLVNEVNFVQVYPSMKLSNQDPKNLSKIKVFFV